MITLENAHVIFNAKTPLENHVLRGINLELKHGEFATIIGGNGAGKSTLMNLISGECRVTSGQIRFGEHDVTQLNGTQRAHWVARVFQDPLQGTFANLSIAENLMLALQRGRKRGLQLANRHARLSKCMLALESLGLGLEQRLHDPVSLLSGGQRQAISLIMATLAPSQILLLDEHTSALSPVMAQTIIDISQRIIDEQRLTTLMITHNMKQALHCGTRILVMSQGRIVKELNEQTKRGLSTEQLLPYTE
jgi:putative ABC transport system ATP-binding protein